MLGILSEEIAGEKKPRNESWVFHNDLRTIKPLGYW